jgi:uncharacterized protein YlaI
VEEEVDEVGLRKAISKKYPYEKPLNTFTCRKGRVTRIRKERVQKIKFNYGQI